MPLYWKTKSTDLGEDYAVARIGNLILHAADIDGDNQPYSIELETKTQAFGKMVPQRQTVFAMDPFFGGFKHAKQRVEYIARCLHYGVPIQWTEGEMKSGKFTPLEGMLQKPPSTMIRGIWVRGIYVLPATGGHFRAEYVSNIDQVTGLTDRKISLGKPSVVLKEIHTDHVFSLTLDEFSKFGFQHFNGLDHASRVN